MERLHESYGGFLPLELNPGREWHASWKENMEAFNTISAGLAWLFREKGLKKIRIPYYYCPSTTAAIKATGVEVEFYHIREDLLPEESLWDREDPVLLVNYFGVLDRELPRTVPEGWKAPVILDNAHSFFTPPVMQGNWYNFYSARKFFGVPDGAYLIGVDIQASPREYTKAAEYFHYLALTYEEGTNAAYKEKRELDRWLGEHPGGMSVLAKGILENVDYERVRRVREENFRVFRDRLDSLNRLKIPRFCPAYVYPLLIPGGGELKKRLVEQKIFVPTLWLGEDLLAHGNSFELSMSRDGIFLPVDQRYSVEDMEYMGEVILAEKYNMDNK